MHKGVWQLSCVALFPSPSVEIPQAFANAISPPPKSPQRSLLFASPAGSRSLRASTFNSKFEIANIDLLLNTIYSVVVEPVMNNPLRHTTMGLGTSRNLETWKLIWVEHLSVCNYIASGNCLICMYGYYSQSKAGHLNLLPNLLAFHLGHHHQMMLKPSQQAKLACKSTCNLPFGPSSSFIISTKSSFLLPTTSSTSIDTFTINKKQVFKMEMLVLAI